MLRSEASDISVRPRVETAPGSRFLAWVVCPPFPARPSRVCWVGGKDSAAQDAARQPDTSRNQWACPGHPTCQLSPA